jgi:hypothetical protein
MGLMRAAQAHGAELRRGTIAELARGPSGEQRRRARSGEIVEGGAVVIAMR